MDSNQSNTNDDSMLYASFNQDSSCFAIGTEKGFRIYNTLPFKDNFERTLDGGIGIVEMLNRCNILALVGGGKNPKYSPNKVILWDDHLTKIISELRFSSNVKNIGRNDNINPRIIVVCEQKIYLFNFLNFANIDIIDTNDNPKGIIAVNTDSKSTVLAYPDKTQGYVRVKSYDKSITAYIHAHESSISFLALNNDGTLLATASDKGTIIRIYRADEGSFLQELRRGKERAEIFSICFDINSNFLASSSDRGTVHIWSLETSQQKLLEFSKGNSPSTCEDGPKNKKSVFRKVLGGYFKSEWSFAQFRLDDPRSVCSFAANNSIIVVSSSGKYYQASFENTKKEECTLIQENSLNISDKDNI